MPSNEVCHGYAVTTDLLERCGTLERAKELAQRLTDETKGVVFYAVKIEEAYVGMKYLSRPDGDENSAQLAKG